MISSGSDRSTVITASIMGTLINFVYQQVFRFFMAFVERDLIPDLVVRRGIRLMLSQRIISVSLHCKSVAMNAIEPATCERACCTVQAMALALWSEFCSNKVTLAASCLAPFA